MGLIRRRSGLGPAIITVALSLSGCDLLGPDTWQERRETRTTQEIRWQGMDIVSYRYIASKNCECIPGSIGPVKIVVSADSIISLTALGDASAPPEEQWSAFDTVEDMFALIEIAIDQRAHRFAVAYDDSLGYPTLIDLDFDENVADDEMLIRARDLEVIQ